MAQRRTPEFNRHTLPKGLQRDHSTKPGVWGVINVVTGELEYRVNQPVGACITLSPGSPGYIPPEMLHSVAAQGDVTFYVEFFAKPGDASG